MQTAREWWLEKLAWHRKNSSHEQFIGVDTDMLQKLLDETAPAQPHIPDKNILEIAERIVSGARRNDYGHPLDNHQLTADYWWGHVSAGLRRIGWRIGPEDVCLMNILQKQARMATTGQITHDGLVDIPGYARNIEMIQQERVKRLQHYAK